MGYGAAAPTIQTGNPQWDRNLGGLAHIFGDPSAYGRGQAAGAAARESMIKGDASLSERVAAAVLAQRMIQSDQTQQPVQIAPPTYHTGTAGGLIMNAPGDLPVTQPAAPPQQSRSLWDMITGQNRSQPTQAVGSPAPNAGAPPAPQTTASNGSVPPPGSEAPDHTINTTGGGQNHAPPANANGSPGGLNIQSILALAVLAGQNPEMVKQTLGAAIAGGREHGLIPWTNATQGAPLGTQGGMGAVEYAALTGNTSPYAEVQGTIRNAATNATTIARENIQQGAETYRQTQNVQTSLDAAGNPVYTKQGAIVPGVTPAFNQGVYEQKHGLTTVGGAGPYGTGGTMQPQGTVKPGTPAYDEATNRLMNTFLPEGVEIGGVSKGMTYGEYLQIPVAQRPPLSKANIEAVTANTITHAIDTGDTGPAAAGRRAGIAATPPKVRTEADAAANDKLIDTHMQRRFAPNETMFKEWNVTRGEPAQIGDDVRAAVRTRADELVSQGVVRNPDAAIDQAMDELTQTGHIKTPQQLQAARAKGMQTANPNVYNMRNQSGVDVKVFRVPLEKPYEPGAVKLAPKDAPDGTPSKDGKYVVHNGFWYPR